MKPEANVAALVARYIAAYNAFDVDGMLSTLAPDVRFENYAAGRLTAEATDAAAFRALAEQACALFSEREQRVTTLTIEQNRAVAAVAYRGRLAVDIPDGPRAGELLELEGESEFHVVDQRIAKLVDRS
ncbi:MAG TPA: nuclear transport factor 2 family protein [Lysobacter sp.]|nr:nuclear transport factor 2 family protein [Lysobacter sp.]